MKVNIEVQSICVPRNNIRGVPNYVINLITNLARRNRNEYSVSFFDYNKERGNRMLLMDSLSDVADKLRILECNSLSYKTIIDNTIKDISKDYDRIKYSEYIGDRADIYHFPTPSNISRNVDGKCVVTVHDIMPMLDQFKRYWSEDSCKNFFNSLKYIAINEDIHIISVSSNTKKDLINVLGIKSDRITVVPLAINSERLFFDSNRDALYTKGINSPYILYLGAVDYRKGIRHIIEAFDEIKDRYDGLKLVMAGNVEPIFEAELNNILDKYKCREDILFLGYVDEDMKRILLSNAEVFLFPSEYEGFGLPVLEAMACHTPVISTNVSSIPEVGGDAIIYSEVNDSEALANNITNVLDHDSVRKKIIEQGIKQLSKFTWDNTARLTEEVYGKLLDIR